MTQKTSQAWPCFCFSLTTFPVWVGLPLVQGSLERPKWSLQEKEKNAGYSGLALATKGLRRAKIFLLKIEIHSANKTM